MFRGKDGCYYAIDECGQQSKVVEISENEVRIKTSYLMRYIAAKQMLYLQFVDSRRSSKPDYPIDAVPIGSDNTRSDCYHYEVTYQSTEKRDYLFSMLFARSIVYPNDVDTCNVWPYSKKADEQFPEFIVEELPNGSYRRYSCDPSKLSNYFGANPGAPHYLTQVFFKPDVLNRYRASPLFEVTERYLSCGSQWGIEIDNVIPERVMVYLGDLGRDLPQSERMHFLAHEISPSGQRISETALAQDFHCSFNAPMGPIAALIDARNKLNDVWTSKYGKQLYRPPHSDENDMEKLIRIPSGNSRQEFDTVILNLTKYCIDYINDSALTTTDMAGGINKLEATLCKLGIDVKLTPLRDLQDVRSACMAHAKGKKYEKLKRTLLSGNDSRDIAELIKCLTDMMNDLTSAISITSAESDPAQH